MNSKICFKCSVADLRQCDCCDENVCPHHRQLSIVDDALLCDDCATGHPVKPEFVPVQTIYFDAEDDGADGFGWNVVDGGAIAARFSTLVDAMAWCGKGRYVLRPLSGTIVRRVTAEEIAAINENLKAL